MRPTPNHIWVEAANRIARKVVGAFNANQTEVLEYLWVNYPGLYLGASDQVCGKEEILELSRQLSQKVSASKKKERFDFLARGFEQGNLNLTGWNVALGPVYIKINREENFARQDRFRPQEQAENLLKHLAKSIEEPHPQTQMALMGQILVSAILMGGLLNRKWLKPFQDSLQKLQIYQEGALAWVEMTGLPHDQNPCSLTLEETARAPAFRLILDNLTRLLVYRYLKLRATIPAEKLGDPWSSINAFFKESKFKGDLPGSLRDLLRGAFARYLRLLPHSLLAYSAGKLPATSLPLGPWLRTVSGQSIPIIKPSTPQASEAPPSPPKIYPGRNVGEKSQTRLLSDVLKKLRYNKKSAKRSQKKKLKDQKVSPLRARRIIDVFLSKNKGSLSPTLQLLLHWAVRLLNEKGSHLERRKKQTLRAKSVDRYLLSFGYALLQAAGDLPLHMLDPMDLQTVYEQASNRIRKEPFGIQRLRQFHGFLEYIYKVPEMEWTDLLESEGMVISTVNANLVSPKVYRLALESLGWEHDELSRWQSLRIIALILLYRCGLRPSETQALRLMDIQGVNQFEILIRNSLFNDVKTNNGIRRIDISKAIPSDELEFFLAFYNKRLAEYAEGDSGLLFAHPAQLEGLLSDTELFGEIRKVLRSITGDETLLLYHLRHSFLSWTGAVLQMDKAQYAWHMPVDGPDAAEIEQICNLARALERNESWGRKDLYLLAMLAGHGSPEITHQSYCHLLDLSLHLHLKDPDIRIPISSRGVRALTYLKRSRSFDLRKAPGDAPEQSADKFPFLQKAVENEAVKFKDLLRHPLMMQAKPMRPMQTPEQPNLVASWEQVIEACQQDECLKRLRKAKKEWEFAASFYEAVRAMAADGRRLKTAKRVLNHAQENFSDRWGGITFSREKTVNDFLELVQQCGIEKSQIVAVYHPRKNQDQESSAQMLQRWRKVLGISPAQIFVGEQAPVKSLENQLLTIKIVAQKKIRKVQRIPKCSFGFRMAVALLARAIIRPQDF